jgi:hypothetical protein
MTPLPLESLRESGTLLYIDLPSPLPPGDSIKISLGFVFKIPRAMMRFGYDKLGNYLFAYWHPILCGYQKNRLVDFEYHSQSEFFSNFSSYDIRVTIPPGYMVGGTGFFDSSGVNGDQKTWRAYADSVIGFAFACGPGFEEFESDTLGIKIRYLLAKSHVKYLGLADGMAKLALAYYSESLFKYPYATYTLADFEFGAGGMELPAMAAVTFPDGGAGFVWEPLLRMTIAHEIAHEWFYGVVATNEAEEPWLDEGLATYMTSRFFEAAGDSLVEISALGYRLSLDFIEKIMGQVIKAEWPLDLKSWQYPEDFSYSAIVYFRTTLMLETLRQMAGAASFDSALKAYANEYRFGHPDQQDFWGSFEKSLGIDLGNFREQFLSGTSRVDYSVKSINYKATVPDDSLRERSFKITVAVSRELDGILPHKITVGLKDGAVIDTLWDGVARTAIFEFTASARPEYAVVGNDTPYSLDENKANNTLYLKSFSSRLLTFEWDAIFAIGIMLSFLI